jgi:GNAT superfamily N-acetyltransferase
MGELKLRPILPSDRSELARLTGDNITVSPGGVYDIRELSGFVAVQDSTLVGLLTYHIGADDCEVVTLHATLVGKGIGTALIQAAREVAEQAGCKRLWLVTTNDNLEALGFYQKRGFVLVTIHRDSMQQVRAIKPHVPLIGLHNIPLRDMIELEISLAVP